MHTAKSRPGQPAKHRPQRRGPVAPRADHHRVVPPVMVSCGPRYGSGVGCFDNEPSDPSLHRFGFFRVANADIPDVSAMMAGQHGAPAWASGTSRIVAPVT